MSVMQKTAVATIYLLLFFKERICSQVVNTMIAYKGKSIDMDTSIFSLGLLLSKKNLQIIKFDSSRCYAKDIAGTVDFFLLFQKNKPTIHLGIAD